MKHFAHAQILALRRAAVELFADPEVRKSLFVGLPSAYVGGFNFIPNPNAQFMTDLGRLNSTPRLVDGTVPFEIWLLNASAVAAEDVRGDIFRELCEELGESSEGARPEPTLGGDLPEYQEALVFKDEMLPFGYLKAGARAGESVVKLRVPRHENEQPVLKSGNPVRFVGTGWLVAPHLVVTNHHVINARNRDEAPAQAADWTAQARNTRALFDFDGEDAEGREFAVAGAVASDPDLDYAVLRISGDPATAVLRIAGEPLARPTEGTLAVNVIQHPQGRAKQIAIRSNLVSASTATDLRYFTDTLGGSSGSPVFDDRWVVVALHRGSQSSERAKLYGRRTGVVNVGTHMASVADHLRTHAPEVWQEIEAAQPG